ncbi:hypothetical protein ACJMK2_041156 [Sinanodonta woodiana]|uniref:Uncharacterized protein n=1 Tax=Sinanodonta woodiana TaxID=1069815 RepID=A0ABD3W375_SINWO
MWLMCVRVMGGGGPASPPPMTRTHITHTHEDPDHPDCVPSVFEYAKRYTTYVHQNKMVRFGNKVKQKIEFESIATSSKKVKKSPEKLNTAVLDSPTPTQQTPQQKYFWHNHNITLGGLQIHYQTLRRSAHNF